MLGISMAYQTKVAIGRMKSVRGAVLWVVKY
jgi:hypothetical protein